MRNLFWHWALSAVALLLAAAAVPGIEIHHWYHAIWLAPLLGLINFLVGALAQAIAWLTCLLNLLTLGCFGFVLSFIFYTGVVYGLGREPEGALSFAFSVRSIWSAMGLAVVMALVSSVLNMVLPSRRRREQRERRERERW
jgi:uncharacterized membrane protein YvlD (DUF360 family)